MRKVSILIGGVFLLLACCLVVGDAVAQDRLPADRRAVSPVGIAQHTEGDVYMKVTYGRPSVRERAIFGELVPFGQVWRTGANEATEIVFTGDVLIGNERLDAGMYSIYTLPREGNWQVIFNSALGTWGAYDFNEDLNVLTYDVTPDSLDEPVEMFTIYFDDESSDAVQLVIAWDRTAVRVPIRSAD